MYIELSFVMHCRYHCLVHGQDWNTKQLPNTVCQTILNTQGSVYRDLYRIGATKVRTLGGYLYKIGATKVIWLEVKGVQDLSRIGANKVRKLRG